MISDIKTILITKAQELLSRGSRGIYTAEQLASIVDSELIKIFNRSIQDNLISNKKADEITLVAVGGYGRSELAPFSDIDIMLLANDRSLWVEDVSQKVLYSLWDTGLLISHSFRTLSECSEDGFSDIKTRTSLIDSRFLAGSQQLFNRFMTDIGQKLLYRKRKEFVSDQLRNTFKRHSIYGGSAYMLEPNIKEGIGGLRDAHCAFWLARTALKEPREKWLSTILPPHLQRHFRMAYDFMLRVRISLHIASGRCNEVLSYDMQKHVADLMGFKKTKGYRAEEILMRLYYREAKKISDSLRHVSSSAGSFLGYQKKSFAVKRVSENYLVSGNEIIIKNADSLRSAAAIIEAFYVFAITGKKLSFSLRDAIRSRLLFINKKTRYSKKARDYFFKILRSNRVYETLSEMHDIAVLDRYIPEFGRLRHLVVYEPYHRFTVDEHTLIAIKNLESLRFTRQPELAYLSDLFKKIKHETLYLAVLLHDIGKGGSKRHEEEGYRIIKAVIDRFDLNTEDRQLIGFLIKNHILLSKLALQRDVTDPETIALLSGSVIDLNNLAALYLMTYADISAVNPEFWSDWKASLLHSLYLKTAEHIAGTLSSEKIDLSDNLRALVEDMPRRYLISSTRDEISADCSLVADMRNSGMLFKFALMPQGSALLTVVAKDRPGIFSRIVWALTNNGLDIANARLFTGNSGLVIDKIVISNWSDIWWEGMQDHVGKDLEKALFSSEQLPCCSSPKQLHQRHSFFESFVELDNESSEIATIAECFSIDRIGLLYDIASFFNSMGLNLLSASINTEDGIAQDVFYLQYNETKLDSWMTAEVLNKLHQII